MDPDPCNICGSSDLNLIDGYYYCSECGTQDTNVRETIVEHSALADGTWAHVNTKKFSTAVHDGMEMSGEWHKWHAYNFILAALTEELINLGAKPSVKMKVLWIWTRYVKKFQVKEDSLSTIHTEENQDHGTQKNEIQNETDSENDLNEGKKRKNKKLNSDTFFRDIKIMTKGVLLGILYIALNLDGDDIQLSHLFKFIREGRLSLYDCIKFLPKELNLASIPHWKSFMVCHSDYKPRNIRSLAMTLFKRLDLGVPLVPDFRKLISNYIKELALPHDFRNLVFSLMYLVPLNFLDFELKDKEVMVRIPDYEGVAMSYVLLSLKMCFGLDCEYEIKLSNVVDKMNDEKGYLKSYKLGMFSDATDRMLSFREWSNYLQFRKMILCKHYLPLAQQYGVEVDDYVFMEHLGERQKKNVKLSDEITMDILNKLPQNIDMAVIPKSEFPPTLTPLSCYTEVVVQYIQDHDIKLLISEDFSQYSLKYVWHNLPHHKQDNLAENIIKGVSEENKTINCTIVGNLSTKKCDSTLVYVRNCENRNWLKTNPPSEEHIKKSDESDNGYESHTENIETTISPETVEIGLGYSSEEVKNETIEEEDNNNNIFDGDFEDVQNDFACENEIDESKDTTGVVFSFDGSNRDILQDIQEIPQFHPDSFNREETIKELVLLTCRKYKIPIPVEYRLENHRKRKPNLTTDDVSRRDPKKRKTEHQVTKGGTKRKTDKIIQLYYSALEDDALNKLSEHVKKVIQEVNLSQGQVFNQGDNSTVTREFQNGESQALENNGSVNSIIEHGFLQKSTDDEIDEERNIDSLISKGDPNFDENVYDIQQLYVKFQGEDNADEVLDLQKDTEIEELIEKQIELFNNNKNIHSPKVTDSDSDSICLSERKERTVLEKKKKAKLKLQQFIENAKHIKKYKMWMRHYKSDYWYKNVDLTQKFDLELQDNFSASFIFVIRECANISECSAYSLYKGLQKLEKALKELL